MNNKGKAEGSANVHNDFILDLIETEEDRRALLALVGDAALLGKLTPLPTSYSDSEQRERRPDMAFKGELLTKQDKAIGERIHLFECKSEIKKTELMMQLLIYITILSTKYRLPVVPVVIYTGKRRLRGNGLISFREHMRSKNPAVDARSIDFLASILNVYAKSPAELQAKAAPIAPGLYLAPRIYDIDEELVAEFFRMCAQLSGEVKERQLEKGCMFIVRYARGFDWDRLVRIEQMTLAEEEWLVGRVQFGREAYGREQHQQGLDKGRVEGHAEGHAEGEIKGKLAERRDIALNLLKQGVSEAVICQTTKLSRKEVQLLKRSL